ncbi:amino acid deaminase [Mesorhizobium huakuii]|uniref:Amino acid deaminase n=1 Tax=Mesorhizobium huakuii TaxID=28104 RepID=A0ABZ0VK60_9HYPH|nr:amino acid deaminase [Mesorhizobium huakuii]WQB97257.1 amino acid deaminase [Mesorhizobium huakuii]GLQ80894.1 amino acid deaminase [Mesorhizobium huakuii]
MHLHPLDDLVLDETTKAIPPGVAVRLHDVGSMGWNLLRGDVPLPAAVIRESALDHNSRWMQRFLAKRNAIIAPHVKTTMCPQIMQRQLRDGAWGVTVATLHQMRVCRRFGIDRIVLANQLVGRLELDALVAELNASPSLDFYMLVDSLDAVRLASEAVGRAGTASRPIQVLVERGYPGGRTGCRNNDTALEVARAAHAAPQLRLCGVEAFEGLIKPKDGGPAQAVADFVDEIGALYEACAGENLFERAPPIVTAGGSSFYDIVLDRLSGSGAQVMTRSGCYVSHDSGIYQAEQKRILAATGENEGLVNALEVWTHVQSCPEPGLAILTAGKRDFGTDSGLPVPLLVSRDGGSPETLAGCEIFASNDQHAYMRVPATVSVKVGDRIGLGVSHPCTTFDKWQILFLVDDAYEIVGALKTYF